MAVLVAFNPAGMSKTVYLAMMRRLEGEVRPWPPKGMIMHVCYGSEEKVRVMAAWESREDFETFRSLVMPTIGEVGADPGPPEISEVHNVIKGEGVWRGAR